MFHQVRSTMVRSLRKAEMDRAVAYAVLGNITSLVLGPITALLVATRFTPELQGYYYTFGSLTVLQFAVELGLGQAIIQFASHEWSRLEFRPGYRIAGDPDALSRLISLGRLSFRWYLAAAILVTAGLGLGGTWFFASSHPSEIAWQGPWLFLCIGLGLNLVITPAFFLLQGCNEVVPFWFYRFVQQVVNGLALWVAILAGVGLWALPFAAGCGLVWSVAFLSRYTGFVASFRVQPEGPRTHWRHEVWPIQWRIALGWFSTFFTSQMFTPLLFRFSGPVVAGQMGMTNTLANVLVAISSNWVVTKAPRFGMLVAQRRYRELDRIFFRSLTVSLGVAGLGALVIWGLIYLLNAVQAPLAQRLLPPGAAGLFLAASVIVSALASLAVYLRAHKREPLAWVIFAGSCAIGVLAVLFGRQWGAAGMGAAYLLVLALFELPVCLVIFERSRVAWHREPATPSVDQPEEMLVPWESAH